MQPFRGCGSEESAADPVRENAPPLRGEAAATRLGKAAPRSIIGLIALFFFGLFSALAGTAWAEETITYTYDSLGRLVASSSTVGPQVSTTFDPAGNRLNYGVTGTGSANVSYSINSASATEGGAIQFTVTKTGTTVSALTVNYATANGSATAGSDFGHTSGTLTFAPTEMTKTITVPTTDDVVSESAENFTVTLSDAPGGATFGTAIGTGTINDNDAVPPSLSIDSVSVAEGGTLSFTVTKSGDGAASASWTTVANGSAAAGADFTAASGTVVFTAVQTTQTISVSTVNDSEYEQTETLAVTLSSPVAPTLIGNATGTGTITDNDTQPSLSIADATATEGGNLSFVVTKTGSGAASASWATSDGAAVSGSDYTAATSTISFTAAEMTKTITVSTLDDGEYEPSEGLTVTLSNPVAPTLIGDASASGTINDNDTQPSLSIAPASAAEGGTLSFLVTKSGSGSASATWTAANVTATVGNDYTAAGGTIVFAASETTKSVTVTTLDDNVYEGDETLSVTLSNPVAPTLIGTAVGTGTIVDNDASFGFSATPAVTEGATLAFTVTRTGSTAASMNVSYASANGTATANSDYTPVSGTLTFAAGETSKTINVNTSDDSAIEAAETVLMNLSGATGGASIGTSQSTGTINDNDSAFAVANATAVAEGGTLAFTVTRTGSTAAPMNVNYASANGTATAGSDYTQVSGTLSFAIGETSKTVNVTTLDDNVIESAETVTMNLSAPTGGATILTGQASGSIDDNDASFAVANAAPVAEGGVLAFPVTRTGSTASSMSVTFATANGTATAGSDYPATSATLTFAIGETSKIASVPTTDDGTIETSETVLVNLSAPTGGATIGTAQASGTINDNDASFAVANAAPAVEGAALAFTVTRTGSTSSSMTVNYASANGTATAGTDYTAASGTLTFAVGEASKTVNVATLDDSAIESPETVLLNLTTPTGGATITTSQGSGTIDNNDFSFSIRPVAPTVEGGIATFIVDKTGTVTTNVTVNYSTSDREATAGTDYVAVTSATLTFGPSETTKNIEIQTIDDSIAEASQEFMAVDLSAPSPGGTITQGGAATRIDDNDNAAPPTWSVSSPVVTEGGTLVFTVTKTGSYYSNINVSWGTNNGSAVAGSDYTQVYGNLTFAPSDTSKTFSVTTLNDSIAENSETVWMSLHPQVGAGHFYTTGTILDDDPPPPAVFSVSDAAPVAEGGTLVYTVTKTGGTGGTFSVLATMAPGTSGGTGTARNGIDFPNTSATLSFLPSETSKTFSVPTTDDTVDELDETVLVNIGNPQAGATIARAQGTGTIVDNDVTPPTPPSFGIYATYATPVTEGGTATLWVNKNGVTSSTFSVTYASRDSGAVAGADYTAVSGTLTFAPGETQKTISVPTIDDGAAESNENFIVDLTSATGGATIANAIASTQITDNDTPPPSISFSISAGPPVTEGGTLVYTVTKNGTTTQNQNITYSKFGGTATTGADFTGGSGMLTFLPSETTKTITVATIDDTAIEMAETVAVSLSSYPNPNVAWGTLVDNDSPPPPSFAISDAPAVSEGGTLVYTVTRSGTANANYTIAYTTYGGGTATMDNDYPRTAGDLVFAPGETTKTISVPTVNDTVDEPNETVRVRLASVSGGATITTEFGMGTINNND